MNPQIAQQIDLALCRSALYEGLALGFRPPTNDTITRLIVEYNNLALTEVAAILDADSPTQQQENLTVRARPSNQCFNLAFRVRQLSQCLDATSSESLEISYRRLFGHTAHSKVPPYETEYGEEALFQQPQELGDIAGFYGAFGLQVNTFERVDHISCECEFLCFLNRKEAYALEENDTDMLEGTRRAQRLFLKDHFGRFVPVFVKLLSRENADSFYVALGNLCHDFARMECARFNVPLGSELMRLRPTDLMDEGFNCGSGEELIQITKRASASTVTA